MQYSFSPLLDCGNSMEWQHLSLHQGQIQDLIGGGAQIMTGLKLPFWGLSFVEFWCWGLNFGGQGGPGPPGPPGSAPAPLTLYLSCSTPLLSLTMQSPHCYIPSCRWSLCINCSAAEGVTEGCILQVLLLTSPGWMEQKIPLLEHVNCFTISRVTPKI